MVLKEILLRYFRFTIHAAGYFPLANSASGIFFSGSYNSQVRVSEYVLGGAWQLNVILMIRESQLIFIWVPG
jgi:hypothetical protein